MALLPELIAAYEKAIYVVFAHPDVVLNVGLPSRELDALLERHDATTAAFMTATAALEAGLAWDFHRGEGRDPQGRWTAEPSLLIAGIGRAQAEALGRRLEQNALLFAEKGKPVELVLLRKMRLVLDTQVWIDWLVFDDPATGPLRAAVAEQRAEIFINASCRAELQRVLGYPLGKRVVDQAACLAACHALTTEIPTRKIAELPLCRDPDDQMFLELAAAARADCLVSRDRALLEMNRRKLPFRILAPGAFARR
jgi:putative PIN family toxin of toxin-antitoxin system